MKFANLICNGLGRGQVSRTINLGDSFEIIAIDYIYKKMGIDSSAIVYIDFCELGSYDGKMVILPINFMFMPNIMGSDMLKMSDKIIPVFLGLSFTVPPESFLSREQVQFLKKWEPIGCRDERTKTGLVELGIEAYIAGCLVASIPEEPDNKGQENRNKKAAFIDAPKGLEKYVPKEILRQSEFLDHEFFVSSDMVEKDTSLKKAAYARIEYYRQNTNLIVTSRFHGAVIALALGIPVIFAAENNLYKFSWLSKILPFYSADQFSQIDWNPPPVDVREIKELQTAVALARIQETYNKHYLSIRLDEILANPDRSDLPALCYAQEAIEYISSHWNRKDKIVYSFWGVNENAEIIYQFICDNYKNAELLCVYDSLRDAVFMGRQSRSPSQDTIPEDCFVIVTSNTANQPAAELFRSMNKKNFFLCKLNFMGKEKV